MRNSTLDDAAIAVVRRNTEEVQGKGNWDLFEKLFADHFVDHTPQHGGSPCGDRCRSSAPRPRPSDADTVMVAASERIRTAAPIIAE